MEGGSDQDLWGGGEKVSSFKNPPRDFKYFQFDSVLTLLSFQNWKFKNNLITMINNL